MRPLLIFHFPVFFLFLLPLLLRVSRASPTPLLSSFAGLAGQRGGGVGCRGPLHIVGLASLAVVVGLGFIALSFVANGEMPSGSLLPSTGGLSSMLCSKIPKWELDGGAVEAGSPFNKGRSGSPWFNQCGALNLPLAGHGDEGRERSEDIFGRSGHGAFWSWCSLFSRCTKELPPGSLDLLPWGEEDVLKLEVSSVNKRGWLWSSLLLLCCCFAPLSGLPWWRGERAL